MGNDGRVATRASPNTPAFPAHQPCIRRSSRCIDRSTTPFHHRHDPMPKHQTTSATMTPREIVQELDRHIVGQQSAKRAVAIALRLATLANAPFVKVEATRFTEVGYVGKDVEQIVRDLADTAVKMYREQAKQRVRTQAEERVEGRILDALLPRRTVTLFGFEG